MNFLRKVKLVRESKIVGEIELNCSIVNNIAYISYVDNFAVKGQKTGPSFFYVLAEIRDDYSKKELLLLCKGAQKSVFPGGLTSESSFGRFAYEIVDLIEDQQVVDIFDNIDISDTNSVASFEEQMLQRRNIISKQQYQRPR